MVPFFASVDGLCMTPPPRPHVLGGVPCSPRPGSLCPCDVHVTTLVNIPHYISLSIHQLHTSPSGVVCIMLPGTHLCRCIGEVAGYPPIFEIRDALCFCASLRSSVSAGAVLLYVQPPLDSRGNDVILSCVCLLPWFPFLSVC